MHWILAHVVVAITGRKKKTYLSTLNGVIRTTGDRHNIGLLALRMNAIIC